MPANQTANGGSPTPGPDSLDWRFALGFGAGEFRGARAARAPSGTPPHYSLVGPVDRAQFVFSARYFGVSRMPFLKVGVHAAGFRPFPKLLGEQSTPGGGEGGTGRARAETVTGPLSPASVWSFFPSPGFEECLSQFLGFFQRTFSHR